MCEWDRGELKEKLKYVKTRLRSNLDEKELISLERTRQELVYLLEATEGRKLKFFQRIKSNLQDCFLIRKSKVGTGSFAIQNTIPEEDLRFSFELCKKMASFSFPSIEPEEESKEYTFEDSLQVLDTFPDCDLKEGLSAILSDKSKFHDHLKIPGSNGVCVPLPYFKESYWGVSDMKPSVVLHEALHAYDFQKKDYDVDLYPYSIEAPAYAMTFFTVNEEEKKNYLSSISVFANQLIARGCYHRTLCPPFQLEQARYDQMEDPYCFSHPLLTLKNIFIGYALTKEMKENKEAGFAQLEDVLATTFHSGQIPDYSRFGVTNEVLVDTVLEMGQDLHSSLEKSTVKKQN